MAGKSSRRSYLAALITGSAVSLSGCTSVVDSVGGSKETAVETEATAQATQTSSRPDEGAGSADATQPSSEATEPTRTEAEQTESTRTDGEWSTDDVSIDDPAISLSSVPLPDDGTAYATMGTDDELLTIYGNWKCPYTREFVVQYLPSLVDEFVRPDDVSVRFRSVAYRGGEPFLGPDAPRATRAGLAVWETDPESFWRYFTYVFANQPQERYRWGQPNLLTRFAAAADVDEPSAVREAAADQSAYGERIDRTVASAKENDVWSVPRVVYDGEVTAPTRDVSRTRQQFREAANR
ncbi:DsbA family protein [Halomicrobium urmianum]|uniref:DsbA family protein n=1 Tax=Halomicrobium urmianum TaxID=1586233 RepID=UPI001CDA2FD6|nr:thioredoxin domain-containing protein [Halomicrobium urmianum]